MRHLARTFLLAALVFSHFSDSSFVADKDAAVPPASKSVLRGPQGNDVTGVRRSAVLAQQVVDGPQIIPPVTPGNSGPVRDLTPLKRTPGVEREASRRGARFGIEPQPVESLRPPDQLVQGPATAGSSLEIVWEFEGMNPATTGLQLFPADPVGDVGPDYYVQMVNTAFEVFDKNTGASVAGPVSINQLWIGAGADPSDPCRAGNSGDPIVLYDQFADRWLLSQFNIATSKSVCLAVSQTSDPTGAYYVYTYTLATFPDFPKYGVWSNAYYMGTNTGAGTYVATAFDRTSMLSGLPAAAISFDGQTNFIMPADFDGLTLPPPSSPGLFYTFKDSTFHGSEGTGLGDRLEVYEFFPDFGIPDSSTFSLVQSIPITEFNYTVCGFFVSSCIPQPSSGQGLNALSEVPMHRLQYRNFGSHETLVGNFTVDASGSSQAGIRWFELRRSTAGPGSWTLHQEGTFAPDPIHRWMGSIAMNGEGSIALGYSVSSVPYNVDPSLWYATRAEYDPLGTFTTEDVLINGGGSQTNSFGRWGDYSSMNVDPVDDYSFWFTGGYQGATANLDWKTRIAKIVVRSGLAVDATVLLEGAAGVTPMSTSLAQAGRIPNQHPFSGSPWSYPGSESVVAVGDSVVDWVLLSLISGDPLSPPMTLKAQRAALLLDTGSIVDTNGVGPVSFEASPDSAYHLVVSARNHLDVMSADTINIVDQMATWNFTLSPFAAYPGDGTALKLVDPTPGLSKFGLIACDISGDGQITASDFNLWLVDTKAVATGYLITDCDLDGQVTASDFNLWLPNTKAVHSSKVPPF